MNECKINMAMESFFTTNADLLRIGLFLAVIWIALYFLSWGWAWLWSWMDDSETSKHNPILKRIAPLFGYEVTRTRYACKGEPYAEGFLIFFIPFVILLLSPLLIIFYEITLIVATGFGLAHLGRFSLRGKKLLEKHMSDKNAHKE